MVTKIDSPLVTHARRELRLAGFFDRDSDYNGMIGNSVMQLVKAFARQGHSGSSAGMISQLFIQLCAFNNLTPITDNPKEWAKVPIEMTDGAKTWQSRRNPALFSYDGGETYMDISDGQTYTSNKFKEELNEASTDTSRETSGENQENAPREAGSATQED